MSDEKRQTVNVVTGRSGIVRLWFMLCGCRALGEVAPECPATSRATGIFVLKGVISMKAHQLKKNFRSVAVAARFAPALLGFGCAAGDDGAGDDSAVRKYPLHFEAPECVLDSTLHVRFGDGDVLAYAEGRARLDPDEGVYAFQLLAPPRPGVEEIPGRAGLLPFYPGSLTLGFRREAAAGATFSIASELSTTADEVRATQVVLIIDTEIGLPLGAQGNVRVGRNTYEADGRFAQLDATFDDVPLDDGGSLSGSFTLTCEHE